MVANDTRGRVIFDLGAWLAGFIKRTTIHCYIHNMKVLGLVVSEKKSLIVSPMMPPGRACMNPRGTVGRIYKVDLYTLLHTKYESSRPYSFREEEFFPNCKSMGANDSQGRAIFVPRGMVGRIDKEYHYTLLHTKYESSRPCGFGEEDFFLFFFPITTRGGACMTCMNPRGMAGRIYKEGVYTLLHTKHERSVPCGFGEEDFF